MAGRLNEEKITKSILIWLESKDWEIICFDFPQSGTGVSLHPNAECRELTKNKGAIIPDIVAVKGKTAILFENKDRFVLSDFEKLAEIKFSNSYSDALHKLLKNHEIANIFFGVGLPFHNRYLIKIVENTKLIDFVVFVHEENQVEVSYEIIQIF